MLKKIVSDRTFWLAFTLGPISWLILAQLLTLQINFTINSQLILVCCAWPLLEEIIFRGYLQHHLVKYFPQKDYLAIILVSLIFSLFHLYSHTIFWSASVFFPSLIFGYFYLKYKSIIPSFILHAWYNIGFFILF